MWTWLPNIFCIKVKNDGLIEVRDTVKLILIISVSYITLLKLKHGSIIVFLNADITSLFTALIKAVYPSCEDKAQGPLLSDGDPP